MGNGDHFITVTFYDIRGVFGLIKDISGKIFNRLKVEGFNHTRGGNSYWDVVCDCGRKFTSRSDTIRKNKAGCGRHIRPHVFQDEGLVKVDVSTDKYPNIYTVVDVETWNKYMQDGGWWAVFSKDTRGFYVQGTYNKKQTFIHTLIAFGEGGVVDDLVTDHINGDTLDNRSCNLRKVTKRENNLNRRLDSRNKTGHMGICTLDSGKYSAYITVDRRQIYLGRQDTLEGAISVRKSAESSYGFHKNHGRIQR